MKVEENIQKKIHPLQAAAPIVGGLSLGAVAFAALAWWVAQPAPTPPEVVQVAPAPLPPAAAPSEVVVVAPEPEAEPEGEAPPRIVLALPNEEAEVDHTARALEAVELGEPKDALLALRHHLHHHEATVDVLIRTGRLAREVGELELAAVALDEARTLDPEEPEVAIQRARVSLDVGDGEAARAAAARAVRLSPTESLTWNLLGRAEMTSSRWEAAEVAFERAVALDPANPWVNNNRGLLYVFMKRGRDAVDALETSVALFGEDVPHHVLNNLGLALELEGRFEEARGAFEEALAVSPFYVKARVNLRRMERQLAARLEAAARRVADGAGGAGLSGSEEEPAAEGPSEATPPEDLGLFED